MRRHALIFFIVLLSVFFCQAAVECSASEADYRPWSGYWWPFSKGGLVNGSDYNGHPAPLEKYDYVTSGQYYGPAVRYGNSHYYDKNALPWEGMCFCWAAASILEEEPTHKGIYNGVRFNVGDKKGLLTVAYDSPLYYHYPTDSPVDFHKVLSDFIGSKKISIIMDLGSEDEIWNHPVFKYETNYTQDGNTRHYTTTIYYITDQVNPDYVGSGALSATYHYYFVVDGGEITASGWEYGSVTNHPKNAREPYSTHGWNTGIDFDEVMRIITTDGDAYKGNNSFEDAAPLSSGRYSLILSTRWVEDTNPHEVTDSDYFKVALKTDDILHIRVESVDKRLGVILRSYNQDRELIQETEIPGHGSGEQVIEAGTEGEYLLEIAPMGESGEPGYELFLQQELSYHGIFPINPSGLWCTGVALMSPDNNIGRTIICLVNRDGFPQTSYTTTSSAHHLLGILEEFDLFPTNNGYIRVDSDAPLWGLQAVMAMDDLMLGTNLVSISKTSSEVFFPHFATTGGWKTSFGLINLGKQTEEICRQSYGEDGQLVAWDTIELAPGQRVENDTSYIGILKTDARSMSASTVSGQDCLIGYVKFLNPSNGSKGRALVSLAMEGGTQLVVPHVASNGYWTTDIAVMNTGDDDSTVRFSAYDEGGNLISATEYLLNAKQNLVDKASDIFPDILAGEITSIKIVSKNDQPLCGLLLYGSTDGLQLAGMPIHPAVASTVYLPHLACFGTWGTGIGVMNSGDVGADISFSLFNSVGEVLSAKTRHLNPSQRLAITIKNLFGDELSQAARYLKIESAAGQPISGIYLFATSDGFRLMGDVIGF
jgi:hypothetical protein